MLIPSLSMRESWADASLSRRVNANSQREVTALTGRNKLIKKGEC